ncbi:hypothetical protein J2X31_003524 [Flavobacterium arsenatis]|uniref:DUF5017 domain-containing protein n=1 Tax=Flavobacterium arsenatis TaxID=1484332 RepID=A0ABU1TUE8_9FLAO|nr:hypothetical protein [Flavobacterium arsenatis]MDR6969491.1 hypothetical protein [Flavobacterium arsenatis]
MKTKFFTLLALPFLLGSCVGDEDQFNLTVPVQDNKVLLLKVDYTTNVFEEGKELTFSDTTATFTVETEYQTPADFGGIQLYYQELDAKIFDGTIHWMGLGTISYPESFDPASSFDVVLTNDFVFPTEGFENVFNPNQETYDYQTVWSAVQSLVKVREYLFSNPDATAKIFLYTPSVGIGNPAEWDWIIILKN